MQTIPLQRSLVLLAGMLFLVLAEAQFGGAPMVRVDTAEIRSMSATTLVAGTVVSRNDANLAAEVEGRLVSVLDVGSSLTSHEEDPGVVYPCRWTVTAKVTHWQHSHERRNLYEGSLRLTVEEDRGHVAARTRRGNRDHQ